MAKIYKTTLTLPLDVELVKKIEIAAAAEGKTRLAKLRQIIELGLQTCDGLSKKAARGSR
jgi:hypothetical protein